MVSANIVLSRLARLEQAVSRLGRIQAGGKQPFLDDYDLQDIADRNLQIAAECCADIAHHLVAELALRMPETSADAFRVLAGAGILPPSLATGLGKVVGMRNLLVHDYMRIDRDLQFEAISNLGIFEEFAVAIQTRLDHG